MFDDFRVAVAGVGEAVRPGGGDAPPMWLLFALQVGSPLGPSEKPPATLQERSDLADQRARWSDPFYGRGPAQGLQHAPGRGGGRTRRCRARLLSQTVG